MTIEPQSIYAAEAVVPLRGFAYYLDHFYGLPGVLLHKAGKLLTLAARCARLVLISAGLPLRKPVLMLGCPAEGSDKGFFSEFGSVLGMLEDYDRWKPLYAGVTIDFGNQGYYFDPARGPNWWEYYFEPFAIAPRCGAPIRRLSDQERTVYATRAEHRLSRRKGGALIARYIRIRAEVSAKVDAFAQAHFAGHHMIGVHYRGTDKIKEAPRVSYETVRAAVEREIAGARTEDFRIFVATDEQAFLEYFRGVFPHLVCNRDAIRSVDGRRVHGNDARSHRKGEEALVDCLLLSRCDRLVRTESNLGLCAAFFNPALSQTLLRGF